MKMKSKLNAVAVAIVIGLDPNITHESSFWLLRLESARGQLDQTQRNQITRFVLGDNFFSSRIADSTPASRPNSTLRG